MSANSMTQTALETVEVVSESPFYIPMTGPAARPRRSLKHDDTFIVLDSHGDIGASAGEPDGLFNSDTRYLARLELVLDEVQPLLLGSNLRDDNSALTVDLTNPDVYHNGRIVLHKDMLHIVRTIFLWRGTAYQRIGVQNHGDRPTSFDLTLLFDNDFADIFEVRGDAPAPWHRVQQTAWPCGRRAGICRIGPQAAQCSVAF
jgi:glycogen debranching enzyme